MFDAAMPETAVNKNSHPFWAEDYVRPHFSISALNRLAHSVAIAKGV